MDFSVPSNLPPHIKNLLYDLIQDYKEENLTRKGYESKRKNLLEDAHTSVPVSSSSSHNRSFVSTSNEFRRTPTVGSNNYIFPNDLRHNSNENSMSSPRYHISSKTSFTSANSTQLSLPRQNSIYRVSTAKSELNFHKRTNSIQLSLSSSDIPLDTYEPMIPLLPRKQDKIIMDSLPSILRGRFENYPNMTAIISIDEKGKDNYISWYKLYLRAEKVAHELVVKNSLYKMDKVILWYNQEDMIEFTVALLGCFIAGMVAVPVSFETYSLTEVVEIIKLTTSKHVLLSNECYKQLDNLHSSTSNNKIKLIKSDAFSQIHFIKTNDLGIYSKAKKKVPTFDIPNVSYIEFTRTPLGKLSGVVMRHKILAKQFDTLAKILDSRSTSTWEKKQIKKSHSHRDPSNRYTIMNSLDPTRSTGLICGVLFNIYSGNLLISVDKNILKRAGGYEEVINKYRPDILLNDQLQLKQVVINFLDNPELTNNKTQKMDFRCIKCCLTSCTTIDTDVTDMVVYKWLNNLGCSDAATCYSPMLTLQDFGGIFISLRDQLGRLENFPIQTPTLRLQDELYVDKEKLRVNIVEPNVNASLNSSISFNDYLRMNTFGFPIPDATLCVANLDDATLVPDLTVGEIWISSDSITNEFYQMERINDFVFNAKINYSKMKTMCSSSSNSVQSLERVSTIKSLVSPAKNFMRTKLMGFIHNGKIYVLSMIEDMFLQNKLVRHSNWAHTSDLSRAKVSPSRTTAPIPNLNSPATSSNNPTKSDVEEISSERSLRSKRVVQTYYLQQISETLVRTVATVLEVSAFELPHNRDEHFLVMVVESSLAKSDSTMLGISSARQTKLEKTMTDFTEQIYRILWIFHKIQPVCVLVVPPGSLPRRYCSLELANSTIEKQFLNGELKSNFVKFQFDHVILDYIPHSLYYNESIFSTHLSELRRTYLKEIYEVLSHNQDGTGFQSSKIDYRESSFDPRTNKKLSDFKNIIEVIEWRLSNSQNETTFSDGMNNPQTNSKDSNNTNTQVSWKLFEKIVASFLKKIIGSKVPLKRGDHVVVMCENSVEYLATIIACWYCNLIVIPLDVLREENAEHDMHFFIDVIKTYDVKRVFFDNKTVYLIENHLIISKLYKDVKHQIPKTTNISKIKKRSDLTIKLFKKPISEKFPSRKSSNPNSITCLIWINRDSDTTEDIHVQMSHSILMNECKILKETLHLSHENTLFSLSPHTYGIGFILSVLLGTYVGCVTTFFSLRDVLSSPKDFLIGLQNMNVKDIFFELETFYLLMAKAAEVLEGGKTKPTNNKKDNKISHTVLSPDFFRNVKNIMIPFSNRPRTLTIESILKKYSSISINPARINFVYEHIFNSNISLRSYLNIPPVDLYLDPCALREGLIKEIDPSAVGSDGYLRIQDSGVVPVCTDIAIVNPETKMQCYSGEFGEIWCCSEANAYDYYLFKSDLKNTKRKLIKDQFITEQFKTKIEGNGDTGLTYLRTGDLGFIKNVTVTDSVGSVKNLNLLYVLGSINESIDHLGLTHFVTDLEQTVKTVNKSILNCIIAKTGGLLVCLIKTKAKGCNYATLTTLVVSQLLNRHGVILDLCAFVKPGNTSSILPESWSKYRKTVMKKWFSGNLPIITQFGINYGENMSIYLLSDFNNAN
ncbi:hypothetical protein TBLA_0B01490 [Henningerozyma blattae CBS 6284]|uniref:DMAP1-binding domain-containing protein n=1 Tax=Henningerozyma blattae (strain ATCC 34711 / CBS 6284 / DSM 70876 / NBRC 10599 / NRRL Y-10934 / UCD 77-7) TaxID=1071380 RepID=I2GXZ0_HENB6|nr:hypothetical protein TBLA_0B01490 [Tetrapisispora blattae CBS 6284]CCH58992.1 hypothetical protein TBLA_0B01490 [Tetrapisispora blattae CBS 6284]